MPANRAETNRKNARKPRIRPALRAAIQAMVVEGMTRPQAAASAGMADHSLREALRKPHVKRLYAEALAAIREGEAVAAYARMTHLAENSGSEHVKLRANVWLAGVDGLSPMQNPARARGPEAPGTFSGYSYSHSGTSEPEA